MSGKVLEIQNLQQPDSLAKEISSKYDHWQTAREEKRGEIKEVDRYIYAVDTTTTTNSQLPWKNKTTLPKLTQIYDNLVANYLAALFSTDTWLQWEADTEDAALKKKARTIEAYMKHKLRASGFRTTISKCISDYVRTGNVFGDVIFVTEKKEDPITGEIISGYVGPKAVRNSLFDVVFNPTAPSFVGSPKIVRYVKTLGELQSEVEERPDLQYLSEAVAKASQYRTALGNFTRDDIDKSEAFLADGFGSLSQYYESGFVEILEFEGNIYDIDTQELLKDYLITVIDRKWIVRKLKNPSWLPNGSRVHVGWRDRPDNIYSMGPLDNLVGLQYRLDHLENLKADALDITIHPPVKVIGDVPAFTWQPGEQIEIADADGDVVPLLINAAAFQVNNEIAYLMAQMEQLAGAPSEAMGIRTPGEKTKFEVQQLQNAAGRIFQSKITKFEVEFLEPLLNNMLETARRNFDGAEIVRTTDNELGVQEFLSVTKEDITAQGKLRPIGARHFAAQAQMVQNLVGISNSSLWQEISPHISKKKLASVVEELFELEKFEIVRENVGIEEQAEQQRLINSLQQQIEVEDRTPVEEGEV